MEKRFTKKASATVAILVFNLTVILLNCSCSKDANPPVTGKAIPVGSEVVYTDISPDTVILKMLKDSFRLDLNNDGIADFEFLRTSRLDGCSNTMLGTTAYDVDIFVKSINGSNAVIMLPLDSATAITPDSLWLGSNAELMFFPTRATGHCIVAASHMRGDWFGVSDKYLGLKFVKGGNTYYGWARLSSTYIYNTQIHGVTPGQLILKDYAYNNIPDQPILAGQIK